MFLKNTCLFIKLLILGNHFNPFYICSNFSFCLNLYLELHSCGNSSVVPFGWVKITICARLLLLLQKLCILLFLLIFFPSAFCVLHTTSSKPP